MKEIAKFKDDAGLSVEVTPQDIKRVLCPTATDKEISLFLSLCQSQRLNPFAGDVYLVKYKDKANMITSKDVFMRRGNMHPDFEGFEAGLVLLSKNGEVIRREGSAFYKKVDAEILGGYCRVHVRGKKPFYDEVSLSEYSTGKSTWLAMPGTMIRKVAIVHAFREAFNFQGMYTAEEMNQAGVPEQFDDSSSVEAVEVDYDVETGEVLEDAPVEVEVEASGKYDIFLLQNLADEFAALSSKESKDVLEALAATQTMKSLGLDGWDVVNMQQVEVACKVLEGWIAKKRGN